MSALILVNFQQKKKQKHIFAYCQQHKLNAQRAILLPNHGGINIAPDVQQITPKKYFCFQVENSIYKWTEFMWKTRGLLNTV